MSKTKQITINFRGTDKVCNELCEGIIQKSASVFYIQDPINKNWFYASNRRMEGLMKKHGSYEAIAQNAYCRESKAIVRAQQLKEKAELKARKVQESLEKLTTLAA